MPVWNQICLSVQYQYLCLEMKNCWSNIFCIRICVNSTRFFKCRLLLISGDWLNYCASLIIAILSAAANCALIICSFADIKISFKIHIIPVRTITNIDVVDIDLIIFAISQPFPWMTGFFIPVPFLLNLS